MSKQPPIPTENQSPYPIEEPPHEHVPDNETVAIVKEMAAAKERSGLDAKQIGLGAAVGVGSAAIVAGLLYWRGNTGKDKRKK